MSAEPGDERRHQRGDAEHEKRGDILADGSYSHFRDEAQRYGVSPTALGAESAVETARYAEEELGASLVEAIAIAQISVARFEESPLAQAVAALAESQS